MVVDSDTKPFYSKQKPRKCFLFSKTNWNELKVKISSISNNIIEMFETGKSIHELWNTFKTDLLQTINENIPSKMFRMSRVGYRLQKPYHGIPRYSATYRGTYHGQGFH